MSKLIHEQLSYRVRGALYDVYNQLGPRLPELFYQRAVVSALAEKGIACEVEKLFEVLYRGQQVGRYYVDIWVEQGQMLLELKVVDKIEPVHQAQATSYLKVTDADLALLVNFGEATLAIERLPNFIRDKAVEFQWTRQSQPSDHLFPELVDEILKALHRVHHELGPGFIHHVYRRATRLELRRQGIADRYIEQIPIYYRGEYLGDRSSRLILVDDKVLVAAFAVQKITPAFNLELAARLRYHECKLGILANFNGMQLDFAMVRR
jgi:GxxExxY protein